MISICITIKDRSVVASEGEKLRLFPACLKAIRDCIAEISTCEVVISDWGSTDWPLEQWVRDVLEPINVKLVPLTGNFSRGQGLNASAAASVGDVFMFLDADCLIRGDFISAAEDVHSSNTAFFPIVYAYHTRHHSTGG